MKKKTTILCTLLFLAGIQFTFGQSHLARKALPFIEPKSKNDNSKDKKSPEYVYVWINMVHSAGYCSQVINRNDFGQNTDKADQAIWATVRKTLSENEVDTNDFARSFIFPINTNWGDSSYSNKTTAEHNRQKNIQSSSGFVKEFTIAVPNKTKSKKQMVYGGSAYVKVKDNQTGDEYYLVATIKYTSHSLANTKSELQTTLELSDYNWTTIKKETATHYTIDSTETTKLGHLVGASFVYTGTASAKVKNFETGEIRTVHSNNAGTTNEKAEIRYYLTQDIV